jgi:hypothetical protein
VSDRPKDRWLDLAALALLAALTLVFFWKIALTNRILAGLDVFAYFYPYRDYVSEALQAGRLPLWNPHLFMGAPLLANSQAAVLYPLHWPLLWLSAPKQVAWSIVLHVWLAGAGSYLFARYAVRLRPLAAFGAGVIFALGGFIGAQVEHVNQLNASAWLPWLLLCVEASTRRDRWCWVALGAGAAIVGLTLLAGHTQAAYIVLFGAAIYALLRGVRDFRCQHWLAGIRGIAGLGAMALIGLALAAGQLLPTLELSRLSIRSSGLPYNEAASFSLKPSLLFKAFLPPLFWEPPFSEYVAYVGLVGLFLAAVGAWAVVRRARPSPQPDSTFAYGGEALVLALVGGFLALGAYNPIYYILYRLVPGFALFRAPARWLLLYGFGISVLAGIGLEALPQLRSWRPVIVLLLVIELFVAGRRLAYNHPTAPAAYHSLRTAPAHLLADDSPEPFRFLSLSDIRYDPGDLEDLQAMYARYLPERAVYDLVVATKMKEVLAYNLPLHYRLQSVDGYDGGLLPVGDYVLLERLFLPEEEIWPDGRLRQQLRQIPPSRLLSLLNVKYVITDKTQDVWIDDIFYDLEHTMSLGEVTLTDLPRHETTHLGIVSYLTGTAALPNDTPVAQVIVEGTVEQGHTQRFTETLYSGLDTAEGLYTAQVAHKQARVGHNWRDNEQGSDYVTAVDLEQSMWPVEITVRSLLPDGQLHLRGVTLIDEATGTSRSSSVDPAYRLVHSGDVKVYQNLEALPRAYIARNSTVASDPDAALEVLRDPTFDPGQVVVLEPIVAEVGAMHAEAGDTEVSITSYEPERVQIHARLDEPGYLILSDAYYPGWVAEVDGQPAPVLRANLYFRAVELPAGDHQVSFVYRPRCARLGLAISMASWLLLVLGLAVVTQRIGRKTASGV